ncbi:MAG: hypothetical protein WB791_09190 [Waddliaceae bacterium]
MVDQPSHVSPACLQPSRPKAKIPEWKAQSTPIYQIDKTYRENADEGPLFQGEIPPRPLLPKQLRTNFLGFSISSPIGVPAGPLLNAKWIGFAARLGFDVVTYKTIRSHEHPSHPLPNVIPVQTLPTHAQPLENPLHSLEHLGITNSFGNPSASQQFLRHDIPKAKDQLQEGQVLIVSVFGTARGKVSLVEDYARTALFAKDCGAHIIEANYSCPNVSEKGGSLYSNPEMVYTLTSSIAKALKSTPLIIKMGAFPNDALMRESIIAAGRGGARAICGLNTVSMKILDRSGKPALGPERIASGVCGGPIREAAIHFTRQSRKIIDKEKLDMQLLATGGITLPHHFQTFLQAGADIAMTTTGMMWDPYLAMRYHGSNHADRTTL